MAVDDRAARCLEPDRAQLVALRGFEVALALQRLQRPEPEEEDGEDADREDAEDADAQRQPRGQPVRRLDTRGSGGRKRRDGERGSP